MHRNLIQLYMYIHVDNMYIDVNNMYINVNMVHLYFKKDRKCSAD
jgi:hypothetical protein